MKNSEIFEYLCELAPLEKQLGFDNAGFLVGSREGETEKVLLSLDVTQEVIDEAAKLGAALIISHHPVIFSKLKSVTDGDTTEKKLIKLIKNDLSVISMHTNLDIADGGVNDVLLSLFGAKPEEVLDREGCGRIGTLPESMPLTEFLSECKRLLCVSGLRYVDGGKEVRRLAVLGGSGGDAVYDAAAKGCDTLLTADIKYHQFLDAKELGINLIDGDHFCTENPVIAMLADKLRRKFPAVEFYISQKHRQIISFF